MSSAINEEWKDLDDKTLKDSYVEHFKDEDMLLTDLTD